MSDKEIRTVVGPIEVRAKDGEPKRIVGYAAVFNELSEDLGGFREMLMPGSFDRALSEEQDVRALFDHDSSKILGRTKSGTLKLSIDKRGLKVDLEPGQSPTALEVMDRLERGDLDGMSFGFRVVTDEWRTEERDVIREVRDLDLFDVSVVTYPAYPQTSVSARALEQATTAKRNALTDQVMKDLAKGFLDKPAHEQIKLFSKKERMNVPVDSAALAMERVAGALAKALDVREEPKGVPNEINLARLKFWNY